MKKSSSHRHGDCSFCYGDMENALCRTTSIPDCADRQTGSSTDRSQAHSFVMRSCAISFFSASTPTRTAMSVSWTTGLESPSTSRSWFAIVRNTAPQRTRRYCATINSAADSISDARHPIFFHAPQCCSSM